MKFQITLLFFLTAALNSMAQINTAVEKFALPSSLSESSGIIFFNDKIITHNDSGGENKLFELDTISGSVTRNISISNATNVDWEDLTQDDNHIYIGDIGNNNGTRNDLKIYKIDKNDYLNSTSVTAETINFSYADQMDFTSNPNNTEWDAEALISFDENNLMLFSKNWVTNETLAYLIPKTPGSYSLSAQTSTLSSGGLITGGTYNPITEKVFLIGYTEILIPFVWVCENFLGDDIFSGNNNQTSLQAAFGQEQAEAIAFVNTNRYFITSESFSISIFSDYAKLIAFNEIPLGNATQLSVIQQPNQQNCDGSTNSSIEVQLEDINGNAVNQSGFTISASIDSGFGNLEGTLNQTTDANGIAVFDDLTFSVNSIHSIRFSFPGLDDGLTTDISAVTGCNLVQWTGQINSDWSNIANWTPQEIPDVNFEVIIPNNSPNYPILDVDASIGDLTMESEANIVLNGFLLDLNGSLNNIEAGASLDASAPNSELFFSASTLQDIPSGLIHPEVANFSIENSAGVILNSEIKLLEILNIKAGNLTTNDFLTLTCTFSPRQTAQIDQLLGNIVGNLSVEQCFTARRAFRLLSPSTTTTSSINTNWQEGVNNLGNNFPDDNLNPNPGFGTHISGSSIGDNGFDATPSGNPSLFSFDQAEQSWNVVTNTDVNTLTTGFPLALMIRGDRSINVTLNSAAPINTKLRSQGLITKGPVSPNLNTIDNSGDFALVGNPFQSIVDMAMVLNNSTNLQQNITVWDPSLGGLAIPDEPGGRGAYVTINATDNSSNNSDSNMTKFLQPYQAFFVESTEAMPSLTFEEVHKNIEETQIELFNSSTSTQFLKIKLYDQLSFDANSTSDDGLAIYFSTDSSNAFDDEDASKFLNKDENLARLQNNNLVSYENRALAQAGDTLNLFTSQYRTLDYVFAFETGDFPNLNVYLYDNFTDTETPINTNANTTYNFSVDETIAESIATNRFEIRIENTLGTETFNNNGFSVYPNPTSGVLKISSDRHLSDFEQLEIYDMNGRLVSTTSLKNHDAKNITIDVNQLTSGIYVLKLVSLHQEYTAKVIVY